LPYRAGSSSGHGSGSTTAEAQADLAYEFTTTGDTPGAEFDFVVDGFATSRVDVQTAAPWGAQAESRSLFDIAFTVDSTVGPYNYDFTGWSTTSGGASVSYTLLYELGGSPIPVFSFLNGPFNGDWGDYGDVDLSGSLSNGNYRLQIELLSVNSLAGYGFAGGGAEAEAHLRLWFLPLPPAWPLALTAVAAAAWRARRRRPGVVPADEAAAGPASEPR
jgi:hypothetical protein